MIIIVIIRQFILLDRNGNNHFHVIVLSMYMRFYCTFSMCYVFVLYITLKNKSSLYLRCRFALSDALTSIYDFDLTSAHLPTRRDDHTAAFTIIAPSSIHLDNTAPSEGRSRGNRGRQVASDVWQRNGAFASRDVRYREVR